MDSEADTLTVLQKYIPMDMMASSSMTTFITPVDRQILQPLLLGRLFLAVCSLSSRIHICSRGEWFHSHSVGLCFALLT